MLDKEKAEAKAKQEAASNNVPEGFGKPQPNADQFQTITFTVKPKKRTREEMEQGAKDVLAPAKASEPTKRPKLNPDASEQKENVANGSTVQ